MKILKLCLWYLLLALLCAFGAMLRHRQYLGTFPDQGAVRMFPRYYSPGTEFTTEQLKHLGWTQRTQGMSGEAPPHPRSSFLSFPRKKNPGRLRIGVFGDSFEEGVENGWGLDYPSRLQELFTAAGLPVEVLNFGTAAYGVHQMHMIWAFIGRSFDLDLAIIAPRDIHISRDTSFAWPSRMFMLHSRYILEKGRLRLIPLKGGEREEVVGKYFSPLPPFRYFRYDARGPTFLRMLIPGFQDPRFNPFYYRTGTLEDEAVESYRAILSEIAGQTAHVVVLNNDSLFEKLKPLERLGNVSLHRTVGFPPGGLGMAPGGHFSRLGHQVEAEELFYFLTGSRLHHEPSLKLDTGCLRDTSADDTGLLNYQPLGLRTAKRAAGDLYFTGTPLSPVPGSPESQPVRSFTPQITAALLAAPQSPEPSPQLRYYGFPHTFSGEETLELRLPMGKDESRATVGKIHRLSPRLGRLEFAAGKVSGMIRRAECTWEAASQEAHCTVELAPGAGSRSVGGARLFIVSPEHEFPLGEPGFTAFSGLQGQLVFSSALPTYEIRSRMADGLDFRAERSGELFLELRHFTGRNERIRLACFSFADNTQENAAPRNLIGELLRASRNRPHGSR